ncbi:MAG: hypothetical protein FWH29_06125 [Methanobrevibacter sp.]|nr:hypothetical protein [Methanobrevibacter sp.]
MSALSCAFIVTISSLAAHLSILDILQQSVNYFKTSTCDTNTTAISAP